MVIRFINLILRNPKFTNFNLNMFQKKFGLITQLAITLILPFFIFLYLRF